MIQSQKTKNVLFRGITTKKNNPLPTNLLLEMSVVTYDSQFIVIELMKLPSPYLSTSKRKKGLCSHLFPVFSLANCSCVSIYVKPPVHAPPPPPPHPKARFLRCSWRRLLDNSLELVSLASRYIFTVQDDQQVHCFTKKPTFSLSVTFSSCVRCIHPSLTHYDSVSVSLLWSCPFPLSDRDTKKHLLCLN